MFSSYFIIVSLTLAIYLDLERNFPYSQRTAVTAQRQNTESRQRWTGALWSHKRRSLIVEIKYKSNVLEMFTVVNGDLAGLAIPELIKCSNQS